MHDLQFGDQEGRRGVAIALLEMLKVRLLTAFLEKWSGCRKQQEKCISG
jgi:hypothetical protein